MSENDQRDAETKAAVPCAVVRDLMPLYIENLTADETNALVRAHVNGCPACAQIMGAQQAKIEMEAHDRPGDKKGLQVLKKLWIKRIAYILLALAMLFVLARVAYVALYQVYTVNTTLAGRYQLSDGRIVFVLRGAKGITPSQCYPLNADASKNMGGLTFGSDRWEAVDPKLSSGSCRLSLVEPLTNNLKRWFDREEDDGEFFYYVFDPEITYPIPYSGVERNARVTEVTIGLATLWTEGAEVPQVTAEEEAVLLEAMNRYANNGRNGLMQPQEDALTQLMNEAAPNP